MVTLRGSIEKSYLGEEGCQIEDVSKKKRPKESEKCHIFADHEQRFQKAYWKSNGDVLGEQGQRVSFVRTGSWRLNCIQ